MPSLPEAATTMGGRDQGGSWWGLPHTQSPRLLHSPAASGARSPLWQALREAVAPGESPPLRWQHPAIMQACGCHPGGTRLPSQGAHSAMGMTLSSSPREAEPWFLEDCGHLEGPGARPLHPLGEPENNPEERRSHLSPALGSAFWKLLHTLEPPEC